MNQESVSYLIQLGAILDQNNDDPEQLELLLEVRSAPPLAPARRALGGLQPGGVGSALL